MICNFFKPIEFEEFKVVKFDHFKMFSKPPVHGCFHFGNSRIFR